MSAYGNNVYLAYRHNGLDFVRNTDGGKHFENPFLINDVNTTDLWPPQIATSKNHVYLSWSERAVNSMGEQVSFRKSDDNGSTFTEPVVLSGNHTYAQLSQLIAAGSHVYVTMMTEDVASGGSEENFLFRASSNDGTSFDRPINLLPHSTYDASNPPPVLIHASDGGKTIDVIGEYPQNCPTISYGCQNQIFFEKSTDFGTTFSAPKVIYNTTQYIEDIHAAASKDSVYLVWGEVPNYAYYMKSDDGTTFSKPVMFAGNTLGKFVYPGLDVDANGQTVYLTWGHIVYDNPPTLFLAKSTDGGNKFESPVNLTGSYGYGTFDLDTSGSSVYLAWSTYQHRSEKTDILFEKSSDNGTTFGTPINLSVNVDEDSMNPRVATVGDDVHVAWDTYFPGDYLVEASSNDTGASFASMTDLASVSQAVPEFPLAVPILLIGLTALIIIYRVRIVK